MSPPRGQPGRTVTGFFITMAIVGILAGASIPVLTTSVSKKAKINDTKSEMVSLAKAIRAYGKDVGFDPRQPKWGRYPAERDREGLYATVLGTDLDLDFREVGWDPVARRGWNGPYMSFDWVTTDADGDGDKEQVRSYRVDAWGRFYLYTNRDAKGMFVKKGTTCREVRLLSGGPDRDIETPEDNIELLVYRGENH